MRKAYLLAGFTLLLAAGGFFGRVSVLEPERLISRKDPARIDYERFLKRFDEDRYGYVKVRHPSTIDVQALAGEISDFLSAQLAVDRVVSPQNARYFLGSEYLSFASLFPRPELTGEARERLRSEVWRRTLFPDDPASFVMLFEHAHGASERQDRELAADLSAFLEGMDKKYPGVETSVMGPRLLHGARFADAARSFKFEVPTLLLCIVLLIAFYFRSKTVVLWSSLSIVASLHFAVLLLAWVSGGVTLIGAYALQGALLVSFISVAFFFSLLQTTSGRLSQRLSETRKLGERPALVFSLALAAFFSGLLFARFVPIRELGLVCALLCLVQWWITFHVLPVALEEFGFPTKKTRLPFKGRLKLKKSQARPVLAFLVCLGLFVVSAGVTSWVGRSGHAFLTPVRKIDLILKPRYWDVFDPDNQAELLSLDQSLGELPGVERVASLASLSDDLFSNLAMRKPGQGEKLRRELLTTLEEVGALHDFKTSGAKEARTVVLLKPGAEAGLVLDGIESLSRRIQGRVSIQVAGLAQLRKALGTP